MALLHVAAIFDPDVSGQRLQAWGCFRDWNDASEFLQHLEVRKEPYHAIGDDGITRGQLYTRFGKVMEILQRWKGKRSWKGFEETIRESVSLFRLMDYHFQYEDTGNGAAVKPNSYGTATGNGSVNGNGPTPVPSPSPRPMIGSGYFGTGLTPP